MEAQFHRQSGSDETTRDSYRPIPGLDSDEGWALARQMRQLLGEDFDPDTLFLEESWTLGVPAAIESWRRRRVGRAERELQIRAFRELDNLGALLIQTCEWDADSLAGDRHATIAQSYDANWPARSDVVSARHGHDGPNRDWTPRPWIPPGREPGQIPPQIPGETSRTRIPCHWVPYGWSPWNEAPQEPESPPEPNEGRMSGQAARARLGVVESSTREEVKSAYRKKVNQWHPDRLEGENEEARRVATSRMAEINEAYRTLCAIL
jgi:hypothetical protein